MIGCPTGLKSGITVIAQRTIPQDPYAPTLPRERVAELKKFIEAEPGKPTGTVNAQHGEKDLKRITAWRAPASVALSSESGK